MIDALAAPRDPQHACSGRLSSNAPRSASIAARRQLFWFAAGSVLISGALIAATLAYLRTQAINAGQRLTPVVRAGYRGANHANTAND